MKGICAFAVLLGLCQFATAANLAIVKDGKSDYTIVLAAKPMPANQRAANELQKYLKQMSGAELAIRDDSEAAPDRAIFVGLSKQVDPKTLDNEKLGHDGFVIKVAGSSLIVAGPGPRGTMYGEQELLERLGVRWYTPNVTVVPKQATIELPGDLNVTQVPAFEYREPFFTEAWDKDWAAHIREVGQHPKLDESTGGTIKYAQFVHTFDRLIPPALFKDHPEYFPMVGGKRINGYVQRCLSNPEVVKLTIAGVEKAFADSPDCRITSVSQNDVDKWCECDNCKKLAQEYGGQSGVYIYFVNEVAEQIEKDLGPDKLIDTLAYQFTEPAPKNITPRKNVRVRLCPINVCQSHPYDKDPGFANSKAFVDRLHQWAAITDTMYIWHYNTNFANYLLPFPDFNQFPQSIKMYRSNGVRGIFFEGAYPNGGGGSDAELRSWVMAKLMWNPDLDSDKLVTEWMNGVYGKAAEPMRQWFDVLHNKASEPKMHFTCYFDANVGLFTDPILAKGHELFDQAEKLAAGDEHAAKYVAKSRIWLRFAELSRHNGTADEIKQFCADARKFGIQAVSEGGSLDQWEQAHVKGAKK